MSFITMSGETFLKEWFCPICGALRGDTPKKPYCRLCGSRIVERFSFYGQIPDGEKGDRVTLRKRIPEDPTVPVCSIIRYVGEKIPETWFPMEGQYFRAVDFPKLAIAYPPNDEGWSIIPDNRAFMCEVDWANPREGTPEYLLLRLFIKVTP